MGIIEFLFFWICKIYVIVNKIKVYLYFEKMIIIKKFFLVYWLYLVLRLLLMILFYVIKNYFRVSNLGFIFMIWFVRFISF